MDPRLRTYALTHLIWHYQCPCTEIIVVPLLLLLSILWRVVYLQNYCQIIISGCSPMSTIVPIECFPEHYQVLVERRAGARRGRIDSVGSSASLDRFTESRIRRTSFSARSPHLSVWHQTPSNMWYIFDYPVSLLFILPTYKFNYS